MFKDATSFRLASWTTPLWAAHAWLQEYAGTLENGLLSCEKLWCEDLDAVDFTLLKKRGRRQAVKKCFLKSLIQDN